MQLSLSISLSQAFNTYHTIVLHRFPILVPLSEIKDKNGLTHHGAGQAIFLA